jgi:glycine betaine/proline transport system ATP-binding protein
MKHSSNTDPSPLPFSVPFSGPGDDPFISVTSLWKVFGDRPELALSPEYANQDQAAILNKLGCVVALQDVSFDVAQGETFVVMGLSGSGKSTLVRSLIRLIEPTSGKVLIGDQEVGRFSETELIAFRRSKVAMVFQHYGLLPHRCVFDNAGWGLEIQGVSKTDRRVRTQEVLNLVGLQGWEHAYPRALSGGMQQRVGLARALAVDPAILLMDEPFSGLDPLIRRNMQDELVRLQSGLRKTIVFITHDLSEALKIGDRIAIMRDGRIIQIGSPEEIVLNPIDQYVEEFTRDVRRESILTASRLMSEPLAVVNVGLGAKAVMKSTENLDGACVFIVDQHRKYLGVLSPQESERAVRDRVQSFEDSPGYIDSRVPPVVLMTSCEEIIPMCLATDSPIPVVDQQGTLVGEIRREAVADAITSGTNSPGNNLPGNNSMGNSVGTNSPGTPENDLMAAPPEASPDPNI